MITEGRHRMDIINRWVEKKFETDQTLAILGDRPEDYSPYSYTLNIRRHCKVHEIGKEVKGIKSYTVTNKLINELATSLKDNENVEKEQLDFSCFIYFITVSKKFGNSQVEEIKKFVKKSNGEECYFKTIASGDDSKIYEKLVYIGLSSNIEERFKKGHKVSQLLNDPAYDNADKRIFLASIGIVSAEDADKKLPLTIDQINSPRNELIQHVMELMDIENTPLEAIRPQKLMQNLISLMESVLIAWFDVPEYNTKDTIPKIFFNKEKRPEWVKTLMAEHIHIVDRTGDSIIFGNDMKIPLKDTLMLAVDKLTIKELKKIITDKNNKIGQMALEVTGVK